MASGPSVETSRKAPRSPPPTGRYDGKGAAIGAEGHTIYAKFCSIAMDRIKRNGEPELPVSF
jgi:hypothetical protein